jgi:hypothetical protein
LYNHQQLIVTVHVPRSVMLHVGSEKKKPGDPPKKRLLLPSPLSSPLRLMSLVLQCYTG